MDACTRTPPLAEANVVSFPREGFIIGAHLCMTPSANAQEACFGGKGHEGDHTFLPWQGCRMRVPFGDGAVPFGGFAW
jgi:hypothetical protein